jgi:hypothetical protein
MALNSPIVEHARQAVPVAPNEHVRRCKPYGNLERAP